MTYELTTEETIAAGIVRCAREQLERAITALDEELSYDAVEAIHSARKAIKKERALLRLAHGSLPAGQVAQNNVRLRDVARTLSGLRDADVMVETVDELAERFAGRLPASSFTALGDGLLAAGATHKEGADVATLACAAVQELREIHEGIAAWELADDGWAVIQKGLKRTYRRGRRALADAEAEPTPELLHAWRKRVKDHWYHLRLLSAVCGPIAAGAAQEADRLSDVLGDDHDLSVLSERLRARLPELEGVDVGSILPLIEHRREQLQAEAWQLGHRLYLEKPTAFERRLHSLWDAGQTARNLRTDAS